ncbi:MAG: T9SS type A sorting domain-containing protein [Bacteroidetes bacterium]|nr:T9SS type A sorting domain-containing protein [Bacteroidota bacterium]
MHQITFLLFASLLLVVFPVSSQTTQAPEKGKVDFAWYPSQDDPVGAVPPLLAGSPAYAPGFHAGARSIAGPVDLDNDGKMEVVISDYSGGGRLHVIESVGVDMWELIYSSPTLDDSLGTANNARGVGAGNLDGDEFGEVYLFVGNGLADDNPARALIPGPRLGALEANGDNTFNTLAIGLWDFGGEGELPDRFRTERMIIADVDGDDVDELLFANNGGDNIFDSWYVVTATGLGEAFTTFSQEARFTSRSDSVDMINRGGGSPYGILPADLDGDGTHELVLTSWNNHNFSVVDVTGANTYVSPSADSEFAYARATAADRVALFGCTAADMDDNGDDEVYCPVNNTGSVVLLNYETGENPLEVRFNQATPESNNIVSPLVENAIGWGIASGDIDNDGIPELIGTGPGYSSADWEAGRAPRWVTIVDYKNSFGNGVEDSRNYGVRYVEFPIPSEVPFTKVNRDSAGVKTTYMEGAGGAAHQFAYLGDVDGDNFNEVAMTFQAVPDSVFEYNEVFNPADSTYTRTTVTSAANPNRAVLRVLSADGLTTRITNERVIVPTDFELHSNYPNPFNPSTTFSFTLPLDKRVSVRIYDMTGRLVRTLINNEAYISGTHSVTWNGQNDGGASVASGQYIYTLEWGQFRQAKRMVLVK